MSEINIASIAFSWSSAWCLYLFTFNLSLSLYLIGFYRYHITGSCFFIYSDSLSFNWSLSFRVWYDWVNVYHICYCFLFCLWSSFFCVFQTFPAICCYFFPSCVLICLHLGTYCLADNTHIGSKSLGEIGGAVVTI